MPEHRHVQKRTPLSLGPHYDGRDLDVSRQRGIQHEEDGSAGRSGLEAVADHHHHERPAASPASVEIKSVGVRALNVGVLKQGSAFLQDSGSEGRVGIMAIQYPL